MSLFDNNIMNVSYVFFFDNYTKISYTYESIAKSKISTVELGLPEIDLVSVLHCHLCNFKFS